MNTRKKLYRSTDDRFFGGVLGGLAEYFGVDSALVRVVWIVFLILTGLFPGLLIYIVAVFMIPQDPSHNARVVHEKKE